MDVKSLVKNGFVNSSLSKFTSDLIERGDISRIGTDAVTTLLVMNHYFNVQENKADQKKDINPIAPSSEVLKELTGLDESILIEGLESLYRSGYLNKESYWKEGQSHDVYRLRERVWMYDDKEEIVGELSWDKSFPKNVLEVNEFKNILASKNIGDARVIHIENLQVNIRDFNEKELIDPEKETCLVDENTVEEKESFLSEVTNKQGDEIKESLVERNDNAHKSATVSSVFEKCSTDETPLNHMYQTYVDRLYRDFASALESAESLINNALNERLAHEQKEPKQPIGLGLLVNGRRWQQKMTAWQKTKAILEKNYSDCLAEQKRLLGAMKPGQNGEAPIYVQEAVQQLKQDHPALAPEIDQHYSLTA